MLTQDALDRLQRPTVETGQRASALRFGDPRGAILGGLALGVIESFGAGYISAIYKDAFAFLVLIVFLLVILLPRDARLLRESKTAPTAVAAGKRLAAAFPERFAESFREKVRSLHPAK